MKKDVIEAIIEIPFRSRNKYERDEKTGRLKLNRVLYSAMGYPTEYGIIENTLAGDGDPLDILVIATEPTYPGCVVPARVIGYLEMYDDGKEDYKVISVVDTDPRYSEINTLEDVSPFILEEIKNFFANYKQLENTKVEVKKYYSKEEAISLIEKCKERFMKEKQMEKLYDEKE